MIGNHKPLIGVAVKHGDITICMPRPFRHLDCHERAKKVLGIHGPISSSLINEGFYTSDGRFFNRRAAVDYARETGQIPATKKLRSLMSTDLW